MAGIWNNLYPPIVNSWMPAFIHTDSRGCRIYFSISSYNSLSDINLSAVQVTVAHQKTNTTALKKSLYPSGIKLATLQVDSQKETDDKYYIQITPADLQQGEFNLNQYYKVQIRFTMAEVATPSSTGIDKWLSTNLTAFSQWSTVCLIRGISAPVVNLNNFTTDSEMIFSLTVLDVVGSVTFPKNEETERLRSYQILIYDNGSTNNLLWESEEFFTNKYHNPNEINTRILYQFEYNHKYRMGVKITTNNLYTNTTYFTFSFTEHTSKDFDVDIVAIPDSLSGCIKIKITSSLPFSGNFTIRRTSNKSNFKIWEDVKTTLIQSLSNLDYIWYDKTIESGVWYKYAAEKRNVRGYRSTSTTTREPAMIVPEDMYLVAGDKQLNIRFDPRVDSFSHTVIEGKTDTIGSKYPFIKRNNYVNYKTFSIGGTITLFMDQKNNFLQASKEDLYGDYKSLYNEYNDSHRITLFNDYVYEKDFREKVIDFLYDNNAKLFRSATQGNIIVKLMDISFSPNQTLGRMIYSFSATAYEIDDFNVTNCDKYNIQPIGQIQDHIEIIAVTQGQQVRPRPDSSYIVDTWFKAGSENDFVKNVLTNKYQKLALDGFNSVVRSLSYLRIEFTSAPYLIENYNGQPRKYTGANNGTGTLVLGHIIYLNSKPIIINKQGIYELKDKHAEITSLYFNQPEQGYIDYIANIEAQETIDMVAKVSTVKDKIGQLYGFFDIESDLYPRIQTRYNQIFSDSYSNDNTYYQRAFLSLDGLRFTADPNTVIYVQQAQDSGLNRHVIGPSQVLEFFDSQTGINSFYFAGMHLYPAKEGGLPRPGEYVQTGIIVDDLDEIEKPMQGGVYTLAEHALQVFSYETLTQQLQKKSNKYIRADIKTNEDIEQTQDSPYETAKHNSAAVPRSHDTLILERQYLTNSAHNTRQLANAFAITNTIAGIKILGIYDNDLTDSEPARGITVALAPIIGDKFDAAKFNKQFSKVLNNNTLNVTVNDLYRGLLERVILESNKYIFYDGAWYPFTDTHDIIRPVTGIVDYYCHYQEGRF